MYYVVEAKSLSTAYRAQRSLGGEYGYAKTHMSVGSPGGKPEVDVSFAYSEKQHIVTLLTEMFKQGIMRLILHPDSMVWDVYGA
jgi:hypothetical protein